MKLAPINELDCGFDSGKRITRDNCNEPHLYKDIR